MAHKFPNLFVHCVFSTKGRRNLHFDPTGVIGITDPFENPD
jgi:hypothetical protein